jgi:glycosyltransferase involved in cell wall biosynthesis
MKLLWVCNLPLPQFKTPALKPAGQAGGGWISAAMNEIMSLPDIRLTVCFPVYRTNDVIKGQSGQVMFYGFPSDIRQLTDHHGKIHDFFDQTLRELKPDIIHVWGTEYVHTKVVVDVCSALNIGDRVIISIQGLCSVLDYHFDAGLPLRVRYGRTLRDLIKNDSISRQKKNYVLRGHHEIEALRKTKHVIGRTDFDKAISTKANQQVQYHVCNESLRDSFYASQWRLDQCKRYSIFVSQATYPIKGLHYMIEAFSKIVRSFPESSLYVAGYDITKNATLKDKIRIGRYGKYIIRQIDRYGLKEKITFVGPLAENEMCGTYLKSHVFVSASTIENSSNSVSEAMMLGVPTVSSYVGGIKNLLTGGVDGFLYQHDAPYMLAYYVCQIFSSDELATSFSMHAREHALKTHDRQKNRDDLLAIYDSVIRSQAPDMI